jgi:hypothetical protein
LSEPRVDCSDRQQPASLGQRPVSGQNGNDLQKPDTFVGCFSIKFRRKFQCDGQLFSEPNSFEVDTKRIDLNKQLRTKRKAFPTVLLQFGIVFLITLKQGNSMLNKVGTTAGTI